MTVAELIEQLMDCDLDDEVWIAYSQQEPYDDIAYDDPVVLTPDGEPIVLVSARDCDMVRFDLEHRR